MLSSQLNMPEGQAKGLAGGLMGLVQGAIKEEVSPEDAQAMAQAVPEAQQWAKEGTTPDADDDGADLSDLLGMGMNMLGAGGGATGMVTGVAKLIEKFGLEPSHAAIAAPLVAQFLESKLDPSLLAKVQPVLAMLSGGGAAAGGDSGGLGGLLGGLLG